MDRIVVLRVESRWRRMSIEAAACRKSRLIADNGQSPPLFSAAAAAPCVTIQGLTKLGPFVKSAHTLLTRKVNREFKCEVHKQATVGK